MPSLFFKFMARSFRKRDAPSFTSCFLDEVEIRTADAVLDFGCGPGSFSIAAAQHAGPAGRVYACDIQPQAESYVQARAEKAGLANVRFTGTGGDTGLPAASLDVVLLYDVLHMLGDSAGVLAELSRVLRPGGRLSISDHHMENARIRSAVEGVAELAFVRSGAATQLFVKRGATIRKFTQS